MKLESQALNLAHNMAAGEQEAQNCSFYMFGVTCIALCTILAYVAVFCCYMLSTVLSLFLSFLFYFHFPNLLQSFWQFWFSVGVLMAFQFKVKGLLCISVFPYFASKCYKKKLSVF